MKNKMVSFFQARVQDILDVLGRVIVAVLTLFYDARIVLSAVLFLIVIDQILGVTYAVSKNEFDWSKFKKVYRKVTTYMSVILAAFVYERYLLKADNIYFTQIIASLVGFQELSSAYITFAKLTGINLFDNIIKKLKG
ncbi:MAG: phage holin family protein [Tannerellaceae bacterium]|nr:phage holin family protein [Tannerellaceae bacterium]